MQQLIIRNTMYETIYRAIGVVWLVLLVIVVLTGDRGTWNFWLLVIILVILALGFLSLNFGNMVNRLTADKEKLVIRWYSRPGRIVISIEDIEEILADENYIRIIMKSGKTVPLPLRMLEYNKKHTVRKFLKEVTGY